jgi:UDP-glucose:(heptosyl)LPS alpha-1,3-glucosyltransferase
MNIAFCYESVLPYKGGCQTYIADLARRLVSDGHEVHLYACAWDAAALPEAMHIHQLRPVRGPRFLRPWRFGQRCLRALAEHRHDVTIGFDKTWGQDVLYPQGGLHTASVACNRRKHRGRWMRRLAHIVKSVDLAHWSYKLLERRQYLEKPKPIIVVNSFLVRDHFQRYLEVSFDQIHVIRSAIDANRFPEHDRLKRRQLCREAWGLKPTDTVALFAAMNYRLKGLEPLLRAVQVLRARPDCRDQPFRLVVAGNPKYGAYQRLARRSRIDDAVRFVGHCESIRDAYFAADFLVHPTFYDPCSLVVLEALACGLPVITTKANGASELIKPPHEGYVIDDPHDAEQLADSMASLLDPQRRHACAAAARQAAADWTFDEHYQALLAVLGEAARRKQAA